MTIEVRRAGPADAEDLTDLHHACWVEAYIDVLDPSVIAEVFADRDAGIERRRRQLGPDGRATWVALRDDSLVGFAAAGPPRHEDPPAPLELYALYTRAAEWGRGTGAALLAAAVGTGPDASPAYLWVLCDNPRARAFYARHGFADDGTRGRYRGAEELRMVRGGNGAGSLDA